MCAATEEPGGQMSDRGFKWRALGSRLKTARLRKKMTQDAVAQLEGVNSHTIWYWESGRSNPGAGRLARLAALYQVSIDWLMGQSTSGKGTQLTADEADLLDHYRQGSQTLRAATLEGLRAAVTTERGPSTK